jgi:NADPH-dependent 2,4-dienoyl-CoA reductase/sulfur reductase-like enzyme
MGEIGRDAPLCADRIVDRECCKIYIPNPFRTCPDQYYLRRRVMSEYRYLIIGGGMTADAAARGIRQLDPGNRIGIISDESDPPYNRPPLSKGLWKGDPIEKIWRTPAADGVEMHLSTVVNRIEPRLRRVTDDRGREYAYEKLLLATGARVRRFPWNAEGIIYFRTLDDYRKLRQLTEAGEQFIVIGGGFIGSEVAAALAMNGKHVTMIFPEEGIGARIYPPALSRFLNSFYESKGVEVIANDGVAGIERQDSHYVVRTTSGKVLKADGVVAGTGVVPNQELARSAGLEVGDGILVDEFLRTKQADIYAAGDVARFYNPALDKRIRVEHEDNANTMGEIAGRNMAGGSVPYHHLPFFYSDLFDLGYEAVGELDSRFETVQQWSVEFREGVVYYLSEGRLRGVLLWNTWGQVESARALIAEKGPFTAQNVTRRLPA